MRPSLNATVLDIERGAKMFSWRNAGKERLRDFLEELGEEGVTGVAVFELAARNKFSFGLLSEQVENVSV